jgi:hypothetical protein
MIPLARLSWFVPPGHSGQCRLHKLAGSTERLTGFPQWITRRSKRERKYPERIRIKLKSLETKRRFDLRFQIEFTIQELQFIHPFAIGHWDRGSHHTTHHSPLTTHHSLFTTHRLISFLDILCDLCLSLLFLFFLFLAFVKPILSQGKGF